MKRPDSKRKTQTYRRHSNLLWWVSLVFLLLVFLYILWSRVDLCNGDVRCMMGLTSTQVVVPGR